MGKDTATLGLQQLVGSFNADFKDLHAKRTQARMLFNISKHNELLMRLFNINTVNKI